MNVVGVVGRKASGKTHLAVRLIAELTRRGFEVSSVKHTHHHALDVDRPGKDSWRHAEAGAREVLLASDAGWALMRRHAEPAPTLGELLARLSPCDLVIVEGYKAEPALPRLEVYRPALDAPADAPPPLAADDRGILAVACPAATPASRLAGLPSGTLRLDLEDTCGIADAILRPPFRTAAAPR